MARYACGEIVTRRSESRREVMRCSATSVRTSTIRAPDAAAALPTGSPGGRSRTYPAVRVRPRALASRPHSGLRGANEASDHRAAAHHHRPHDDRRRAGPALAVADDLHGARSDEHTPEIQSLMRISYPVFCLQKQKTKRD